MLHNVPPLPPREGTLRLEQFEIKVNNEFWDNLNIRYSEEA
jgi:hypothetical protein